MRLLKAALRFIVQDVRFAHKSPKQGASTVDSSFGYEDLANKLKGCQLEINSGAGGTESMLFASELMEMYHQLCLKRNWNWLVYELEKGSMGGVRSALAMISGQGSYSTLRFEAGVHRVQRVPVTDKSRMHTSTVSVAVLPEPEETEISFPPEDIKFEAMRAGGPGGQNVNKRSSAVRLTHLPTNISVRCMDERFQHENLKIAYKRLAAILLQQKIDDQQSKLSNSRRLQVGSKARAEKIRTYNFKDNRVTDHRLRLSANGVEDFLKAGDGLDLFINELAKLNKSESEEKQ